MEQFGPADQTNEPVREKSKEADKTPDKNSAGKYDIEYQKKIIRFFNNENIKSREDDPDFDPDQDLDISVLNNEMSSDLKKLSRENGLKNLNPEEYSYALSYLIREMDCNGSQLERVDPEAKKSIETRARQAKELFMESCKKIYPDIDEKSSRNPQLILGKLKSLRATYYDVNFEIVEIAEFAKRGKAEPDIKKLTEMAKKINLIFSDIEFHNQDFVHVFKTEIEGGDKEYIEEYKKKKAIINEYIYEFMLTRDSVYEKLYGNKDISLEDAKKMDEAREKIETN